MPGAGLSAEQVAREGLVNEGWVVSGGGRGRGHKLDTIQVMETIQPSRIL